MAQYGVPVEMVDSTGTESHSKVLWYVHFESFHSRESPSTFAHLLLSSVPISACINVHVHRVVQFVRFSNAWGRAKVLSVVLVKSVMSSCIAVCPVTTVSESDLVDSGMSDSMSIPASDMLSQLVVGVSSSACNSADTDSVSPAIEY